MTPYLILLFVSVVVLYVIETFMNDSVYYNRFLKIYFILLSIVMVLFGTLRSYHVGADTSTYFEYFLTDFYYSIEIGYISLSRLISHLGFDFRILLFTIQMIIVIPILIIIYKVSKIKWLSIFLYQTFYLYVNSFNIMRQSIAMTFVLIAVCILINFRKSIKRNFAFIATIGIATLFHSSALIFIVLLPLKDYKPKVIELVIVFIVSMFVMFFRQKILTDIFDIINRSYYTEFRIEIGLSTIVLLIIFIVLIVHKCFKETKSDVRNFIINLLVGSLFFNLVWSWFPNHARITMYVFLILSIYYPNVLIEQKEFENYNFKLLIIVFIMLCLYLFQLTFRDYGHVVPYHIF